MKVYLSKAFGPSGSCCLQASALLDIGLPTASRLVCQLPQLVIVQLLTVPEEFVAT